MYLVVGLGETGQSVGRFLSRRKHPFCFWDTRKQPPALRETQVAFPGVQIFTGERPDIPLSKIHSLVVSPGVSLTHPFIQKAKAQDIPIVGDIELFVHENNEPLVAITGSNGKSTVTTLVGEMLKASGLTPAVIGNIGIPALDALVKPEFDVVVMEVSSFQLETTYELNARVAVMLNLTPDHLDRHLDMASYQAAKQRIYIGAEMSVANRQDVATWPPDGPATLYFSNDELHPQDWHIDTRDGVKHIAKDSYAYPVSSLPIQTEHHLLNVCAAMAVAQCLDCDLDRAFAAACHFQGLRHRCQKVAEVAGVQWYNDSKATNVGATVSSIESVAGLISGKTILILGGVSKQTGFEPLLKPVQTHVKHVLLIGETAEELEQLFDGRVKTQRCEDMRDVVLVAKSIAQSGDAVLLAPACASFDMFKNYADRGEQFEREIAEVIV